MRRLVIGLAIATVVLTGCGRGDRTEGSGSPKPGASPQAKESTENKLPEGFPADFPLPQGKKIIYSAVTEPGSVVFIQSGLAADQARKFMLDELPKAGWKVIVCNKATSPQPVTTIQATKKGQVAGVTIGFAGAPSEKIKEKYDLLVYVIKPQASAFPEPSVNFNC